MTNQRSLFLFKGLAHHLGKYDLTHPLNYSLNKQ